jgi:hypothetical protein
MAMLLDDPACLLRELDLADTGSAHRAHQRSLVASLVRKLGSAADALDLDHGTSSALALTRVEHAKITIPRQTGELSSTFSLCNGFRRPACFTSSRPRIDASPILRRTVTEALSRVRMRPSLALFGVGMQEFSTSAFPLPRGWLAWFPPVLREASSFRTRIVVETGDAQPGLRRRGTIRNRTDGDSHRGANQCLSTVGIAAEAS